MRRAVWLAVLVASGCALAHERDGDASASVPDTGTLADTGSAPRDSGPITSCVEFWSGLSACPASPSLAIGLPCSEPGATCGVHCCEPGPPIACQDGRWSPVDVMDDCRGVRCSGPHACGMGSCAAGRVCVVPAGEIGSPAPERCVVPPAPIDTCGAAPSGSLGEDAMSCTACTCGATPAGDVVVTLDCRCC